MASIVNRSRFTVSVKNRPDLYREFRYNNKASAQQYSTSLAAQALKPISSQLEDTFHIRIREQGQPDVQHTFGSLKEAQLAVGRIEGERSTGLFIDYTKAHKITFAKLILRYMRDEGPKKKGWHQVEKYKCLGWLADVGIDIPPEATGSGTLLKTKHGQRMRTPATSVQWMLRPFAAIQTTDIEDYIAERLQEVKPATVDRELDVIRAIFTVATKIWKFRLAENPMDAVRRPKYFNERDRRIKVAEEQYLFAAAYDEDRRRSIELRVKELVREERQASALLSTVYARKKSMKEALQNARQQAEQDYVHIPLFETLIHFLLMTAARRGEALKLGWQDLDFDGRSAYLAETKNGLPRSLPLRERLVIMLKTLPRDGERVFAVSMDALRKAWVRITSSADIQDLHIHDLRHEAISRVAETSKFSLIDLQKFSGHRDIRMLMRYAHLCTRHMALKLDEAFANEDQATLHRGRRRLKAGATVSVTELVNTAPASNVIPLLKPTKR
jgi:integrase